ncbi:DUF4375 domain-containing protein [Agromyces sp. NPDC058136]|uniref:DMP19 family protein n=1 Tax=Agromyces sp. NPDC058136 TaxID=3346354 RepID=UPI0036DBB1FD
MGSAVAGAPVRDVVFEPARVLLLLDDGRALAAPISWVGTTVAGWGEERRAGWVRTADGRGVNWPDAGQASEDGALNVWVLEQDALFEHALHELADCDWDVALLAPRSRSLVALWRLTADGYNGGLLQFLGNWGTAEVHAALGALAEIGATSTLLVLREFWGHLAPIAESDDVSTIDDVYAAISSADLSARIDELDERFWEAAEELISLVPRTFGPAPSAIEEHEAPEAPEADQAHEADSGA